jgi:hypothetical protein
VSSYFARIAVVAAATPSFDAAVIAIFATAS